MWKAFILQANKLKRYFFGRIHLIHYISMTKFLMPLLDVSYRERRHFNFKVL